MCVSYSLLLLLLLTISSTSGGLLLLPFVPVLGPSVSGVAGLQWPLIVMQLVGSVCFVFATATPCFATFAQFHS